jgi:hypothetical protein
MCSTTCSPAVQVCDANRVAVATQSLPTTGRSLVRERLRPTAILVLLFLSCGKRDRRPERGTLKATGGTDTR